MAGEIISAEEARRLREAARPGPWDIGAHSLNDQCQEVRCVGGIAEVWAGPREGHGGDVDALADASLIAAAPDLARTVEHLHAELAAEREAVLAFLLGMARTAETPQARGLIATIRRAIELRYHRDPLRTPRTDGEVSDG